MISNGLTLYGARRTWYSGMFCDVAALERADCFTITNNQIKSTKNSADFSWRGEFEKQSTVHLKIS